MTHDEILARVTRVLVEKMKCDPDAVTPSATLVEIGLASIDIIDAMFEVEEEFNITLSDDTQQVQADFSSDTVETLVIAVEAALAAKNDAQSS